MAFPKPSLLVNQVYTQAPEGIVEPLRACVLGPNAILHRYSETLEKPEIYVGEYVDTVDTCYSWPGRSAGGVVDNNSVRVFIDKALLQYHEDLIGVTTDGRGTVTPVSGYRNRIQSSTLNYKSNGASYPRSAIFYDRDVQIGDRVHVRGVVDPLGDCDTYELWTHVAGFAATNTNPVVGTATNDAANQGSQGPSSSINQIAGVINCVSAVVDGSTDYDGLASGNACETYTITVVSSSVSGCSAARLRVTSASGTDDQAEVTPEDFGSPTAIGTRGLFVTFDTTTGSCSSSGEDEGFPTDNFVVGQTWEVEICQEFEEVCATAGGTYSGADDDTYIVTVTKGGVWADSPEITVTTTKGLDFSGPTVVSADDVAVNIGTKGVTILFTDCNDPGAEPGGASFTFGDSAIAGLCAGDKFYVNVTAAVGGNVRTLILRHDLPEELATATDLDLRLFIEKDIELSMNRESDPPNLNYELETTQICINAGATTYDESWTNNGVELPLPVKGGCDGCSLVYVQYREWVQTLVDQLNFAASVDSLDDIPGQLDEDNPLKWGVFRALQNSAGVSVGYIAVPDDTDNLDDYQTALDRCDGREDIYNFVAMTYDREVLNLIQTHVNNESGVERANWKAMVGAITAPLLKMIVGKSEADAQLLSPTSTDGGIVLAKLLDNPQATGSQYTLLTVPAANSNFITYGVKAGDLVRFLFTADGFGNQTYAEFVVDSVLSENALLLQTGHVSAVSVAQKVEIWRSLSRTEMVTELSNQAQAFANSRAVMVWPDKPATAGNIQPGYFLAAAVAGAISGVVSHQGMTNMPILGFDDVSTWTNGYFTDSQLTQLSNAGIWVVQEDRDGTPITRHAVTTDVSDVKKREEMYRRNVDAISYVYSRRLRPYIGRANVTNTLLNVLRFQIDSATEFLRVNGFSGELGGQVISAEIVTLRQHPLAADRVEIVLNLTLPLPVNNIELYLIV